MRHATKLRFNSALCLALLSAPALLLAALGNTANAQTSPAPLTPQPNGNGSALTISSTGSIDRNNPFFKPFGNGRNCASCHQESQGWTITPSGMQALFTASNGSDPVFALVDGANSPKAVTTTLAQKRAAYSMLLNRGVIRVGMPIPAGAEFTLVKTDDPYGFASAAELSLFRRPLPTTNLKFLSTAMWDARETFADAKSPLCILNTRPAKCFSTTDVDLLHQSNDAVRGHAQAVQDLSAAQQRAIVDFEKTLTTAQLTSTAAGALNVGGARGGPVELAKNAFYFGINDVQDGDYLTKAPFNRNVMNLYGAWLNLGNPAPPPAPGRPAAPPPSAVNLAKAAIARGEQIFNNRPMNIGQVAGFSDELRVPLQRGTCSSCHNSPNAGSHAVPRLFNTGVSDGKLRTADLPLYTLKNTATGETVQTSDPGNALVTGKWKDIGRVKTPSLRALEARSPYFHNGSATELIDVVNFYDTRFRMGLTLQEKNDLVAFLGVL
jgi:mono/diheme cytochrome c family protein